MSKEFKSRLYEILSIIFLILSFSISKYNLFNLSDKHAFLVSLFMIILSVILYIFSKKNDHNNNSIFSEKIKIVLFIVSLVIILLLLYF